MNLQKQKGEREEKRLRPFFLFRLRVFLADFFLFSLCFFLPFNAPLEGKITSCNFYRKTTHTLS